jgi:hypothetical protein
MLPGEDLVARLNDLASAWQSRIEDRKRLM